MKGREEGRGKEKNKQNMQTRHQRKITNFYVLFLLHLKTVMNGVGKLAPPVVVRGKSTNRASMCNPLFHLSSPDPIIWYQRKH